MLECIANNYKGVNKFNEYFRVNRFKGFFIKKKIKCKHVEYEMHCRQTVLSHHKLHTVKKIYSSCNLTDPKTPNSFLEMYLFWKPLNKH